MNIQVKPQIIPPLDPGFLPGSLWNRAYSRAVDESGLGKGLAIALHRPSGSASVFHTKVFPHSGEHTAANERYVERVLKFLLWQRGGSRVIVAGDPAIADFLRSVYSETGVRRFDYQFMGERVYRQSMTIESTPYDAAMASSEAGSPLGRHLDGCRIGFDLGGSDRKCSAVMDGKVLHTEEVVWDPYFQSDPQYHFDGINDSLKRAAAFLPRVDAIGGSSAGVYVDNEVRVASLFRGVSPEDFEARVRRIFFDLQKKWDNVPFVVVNDGEVTALAGSMSLEDNAVLGVAMGTSEAAGYVTPQGNITDWLNELAFAPVDYRDNAPVDEWSGDGGVGAQYFSQQAVSRLLPAAGIDVPAEMPFAERLITVQKLMTGGDERAKKIFETIGVYLGYAAAQYASMYEVRHMLILGRVTSGGGGEIILEQANKVLSAEFADLTNVALHLPSEKDKRLGQAVAAASLPSIS